MSKELQFPAINKHLKNIFDEGELNEEVVISILEMTTAHGTMASKTQKITSDFELPRNPWRFKA